MASVAHTADRQGHTPIVKIMFINYEFPPVGGGAGNACYFIARDLAAMGHRIAVITSLFGTLPREEVREGVRIYRIPTLRKRIYQCALHEMGVFCLSLYWHGLRLAEAEKPDVVVIFFAVPFGYFGPIVKARHRIPYVVSLRGGDVPGFCGTGIERLQKLFTPVFKQVCTRASRVIANSEGLAQLAKKSVEMDVQVIPNGVDAKSIGPRDGRVPDQGVRFVFVGRLTRQKGLHYLVEAHRILQDRAGRFTTTIVGDGPLRKEIEDLARKVVVNNMRFTGWLTRPEVLHKLGESDVFVLPSVDEGMPNVVLEAMASGLPVIGSRVSGMEELVTHGKSGYLVAPGNCAEFAQRMITYIENGEKTAIHGKISRRIAETMDWGKTAKAYERVIQSARQTNTLM